MATFKAFKPEAMQRIARSMGHTGDMNQFENFLMANPEKSNMMRNYNAKAMQMAEGGVVKKMQEGGAVGTSYKQGGTLYDEQGNPITTQKGGTKKDDYPFRPISPMPIKPLPGPDDPPATDPPATDPPATDENTQNIMDYTGDQITNPVAPIGGTVDAEKIDVKDENDNIIKHNLYFLLVYPNIKCSTRYIYSKVKKFTSKSDFSYKKINAKNKFIKLLLGENNNLQSIVENKYPNIKRLIVEISQRKGCYFSRMTGSGSVCYGVFKSKKSAKAALNVIKLKYPKYWSWVAKTI